jgi:hypothetical protein
MLCPFILISFPIGGGDLSMVGPGEFTSVFLTQSIDINTRMPKPYLKPEAYNMTIQNSYKLAILNKKKTTYPNRSFRNLKLKAEFG